MGKKNRLNILILSLILFTECGSNIPQITIMPEHITIYRDTYGVPHIYGPTDESVVFGFAWAQCEDNFEHLEDNFIRAIGRAAEVHGEEAFLDDRIVHAMEIVKYSKQEYEQSSPKLKSLLNAFADGLNHYLSKNKNLKTKLLHKFEPWHPIAMLRYKYHKNEFLGYAGVGNRDMQQFFNTGMEKSSGSNAWAISPSKTTTGNSMLLINPHVGFFGYGLYTEVHLHSEEGWNFSGVSRFGFPFPYMGHNETLGWGHTDNYSDIGDLYAETFDKPSEPLAYKYGNGYKTAVTWKDAIKVKSIKEIKTVVVDFIKTHHGPVLLTENGKPVSVRLSKYEEGGWFEQWFAMTKSKNVGEFKKAIGKNAISYMNIVCSDAAGNIYYIYNGVVPKRNSGFDYLNVLDGSNPLTDWTGYYSTDELPQITNPASGFLQNCNSNPFYASLEFLADSLKYPKAIVGGEPNNYRSKRSQQILNTNDKFSFEKWEQSVTDTKVLAAVDEIPVLLQQWEQLKLVKKAKADELLPLIDELRSWNHISTNESVAMTLFTHCTVRNRRKTGSNYMDALAETKQYLETNWGTWKVSWGSINRLQRVHWNGNEELDDSKPSVPVPGSGLSVVFSFYPSQEDYFLPVSSKRKSMYGRAGNSYVSIVEFGKRVKAKSLFIFGQSGNPSSKHYFDQAELYSKKKFKPAWFYLDEIEKNLERKYHPGD